MDGLIASILFKNKTCMLPGIGLLQVLLKSAETDYVKQTISAPQQYILFSAAPVGENFFNEFTALSELIKKELDIHRMFSLKGIGDLIKNDSGTINFIPLQIPKYFLPVIDAKQRMLEDEQNALLLVEQKFARAERTKLFVDVKGTKSFWRIWAIALGVVAVGALAYYISKHGVNGLANVPF